MYAVLLTSSMALALLSKGQPALVPPEVVPVVVPADPFVFVEIQPPILACVFPVFLVYPRPSSTSSRLIEVEGCWPAFPAAHPPTETGIIPRKVSHLTYLNHALLGKGLRGSLEVRRKKRAPRVSSRRSSRPEPLAPLFVMPCALSTDDIASDLHGVPCRGVPLACRAALALPRHTAHLKSFTSKRENARENEKKVRALAPSVPERGQE